MTLRELKRGETGKIDAVGGEGALRQHFLDMGMIPGAEVTFVKTAPMGDPMEFQLHGYELTLRIADAEKISVTPVKAKEKSSIPADKKAPVAHPALGEPGIHHDKANEDPLPFVPKASFVS